MRVELFDSFEEKKKEKHIPLKKTYNIHKKTNEKMKSQFEFIGDFTRDIFEPNWCAWYTFKANTI